MINRTLGLSQLPLSFAIAATLGRSIIHAILAATEYYQPETAVAVVLDLPTICGYFIASGLGYAYDVDGFLDLRFFIAGAFTWFALGFAFGFLLSVIGRNSELRHK